MPASLSHNWQHQLIAGTSSRRYRTRAIRLTIHPLGRLFFQSPSALGGLQSLGVEDYVPEFLGWAK